MTRYLKKTISLARIAAASVGLLVTASQIASAGVMFECDLKTKHPNGWVSPKMAIVFEDKGAVTVFDGVIRHFIGDPIPAKASRRGEKMRLTWTIANTVDDKGERAPTMSYIANVDATAMKISVIAKPVGYPQRFSAKGVCKSRNK